MFSGQFYEKWVSVRERNIKLLLETVTYIATTETVTCIITTEIAMCIMGGSKVASRSTGWLQGRLSLSFF